MLATGRPGDLVARFGGEEFVLLLPETGAATAREIAEYCQRMIGNMGIPHEKSPISPSLTVSMGVGTATPLAQTDAMDFMHSVDQLLYAAKQNGRNRIEAMP